MSRANGDRPRRGVISGYVLKLARESTGHSQEKLAELLGAGRNTIQGWESGRRPLTSVGYGEAVALQRRLLGLGGRPDLVAALAPAADADLLLASIIDQEPENTDLNGHPIGWTVQHRSVVEMLMWAATGAPPRIAETVPAGRRGPVADGPELGPGENRAFFDHLRVLADRARGHDEHLLLHRQASFLGSSDPDRDASEWLRAFPQATAHLHRTSGWSPYWADARSLAVSLAREGDPEPLRDFIATGAGDPSWETANLNYWAYWVGETREPQPSDHFMADPGMRWSGSQLYAHLTQSLGRTSTWLDLNVHTLWALLTARRGLTADDPESTALLLDHSSTLLDSGMLSSQSADELRSVRYALAMQGFEPKEQP